LEWGPPGAVLPRDPYRAFARWLAASMFLKKLIGFFDSDPLQLFDLSDSFSIRCVHLHGTCALMVRRTGAALSKDKLCNSDGQIFSHLRTVV
jgi:hypothetical protein